MPSAHDPAELRARVQRVMAVSSAAQAESVQVLIESMRRLEECERLRRQRASDAAEWRARMSDRRGGHS
jgi:hypothetical protein